MNYVTTVSINGKIKQISDTAISLASAAAVAAVNNSLGVFTGQPKAWAKIAYELEDGFAKVITETIGAENVMARKQKEIAAGETLSQLLLSKAESRSQELSGLLYSKLKAVVESESQLLLDYGCEASGVLEQLDRACSAVAADLTPVILAKIQENLVKNLI